MHMNKLTALSDIHLKWPAMLAGVFCLAIATAALAEETAKPCRDDAARLCKDVKPGGGAVAKCLKEHHSELSSACKEKMEQAREKAKQRAKEFKEACRGDVLRHCPSMKPGGGAIVACLKAYENQLSAECKEQMHKMRDRRGESGAQPDGHEDDDSDK
jgi:Cysteine rich repeat